MELTTHVAATVRRSIDATETTGLTEVRALLYSAFPVMFGLPGVLIEPTRDTDGWFITVPTKEWENIESEGYFEHATRLGDNTWIKLEIEFPY